ncbi:MAG: hypothetical protein V4850_04225 [Myxococcota bacterium]
MRWELNEDFYDFLVALQETGAEFVIVGAHALAAHGVVRATGDLDILFRETTENAERVFAALTRFGAPVRAHGITPAGLAEPYAIYQMGLPPRRIDLLNRVDGPTFDEIWAHRLELDLFGLRLPFIGRAELIANKRAAGRPKDLLDVDLLLARGERP